MMLAVVAAIHVFPVILLAFENVMYEDQEATGEEGLVNGGSSLKVKEVLSLIAKEISDDMSHEVHGFYFGYFGRQSFLKAMKFAVGNLRVSKLIYAIICIQGSRLNSVY